MPSDDRPFKIGHSPVMMTYLVGFFVVWSLIFFAFTADLAANKGGKEAFALIPTVLLLLALSLGVRAVRVAIVHDVERNQLVVRNYFSTFRLPKNQISGFNRESDVTASAILGRTVQVQMRGGGEHQLEVFTRPLLSQKAREHHETSFEALQAWHKRVR